MKPIEPNDVVIWKHEPTKSYHVDRVLKTYLGAVFFKGDGPTLHAFEQLVVANLGPIDEERFTFVTLEVVDLVRLLREETNKLNDLLEERLKTLWVKQ
jgi:hypothetical protein